MNGNNRMDFAEGVRQIAIDKDVVKPVQYLPDDFLVYEIPESKISEPGSVSK